MGFLPDVKGGAKGCPGHTTDFQTIPMAIPIAILHYILPYNLHYNLPYILQYFSSFLIFIHFEKSGTEFCSSNIYLLLILSSYFHNVHQFFINYPLM